MEERELDPEKIARDLEEFDRHVASYPPLEDVLRVDKVLIGGDPWQYFRPSCRKN